MQFTTGFEKDIELARLLGEQGHRVGKAIGGARPQSWQGYWASKATELVRLLDEQGHRVGKAIG